MNKTSSLLLKEWGVLGELKHGCCRDLFRKVTWESVCFRWGKWEFVFGIRVNYKVSACGIFAGFRVIATRIYWF